MPQSTRKPANSSKTYPPLPVCIGLDSVGVSATLVHFNAGHLVNVFPFSPVCEPSNPIQFGLNCSPTTFGSVTTSYLVHGKKGNSLSVYPTVEAGGLHGDKWVPSSKGTWLVREKALELKRHSPLSWIVPSLCPTTFTSCQVPDPVEHAGGSCKRAVQVGWDQRGRRRQQEG